MPTKMHTATKSKTSSQVHKTRSTHLKWKETELALKDIKSTFGILPTFTNNFTDQSLPGAWAEAKSLRFSTNTALDIKLKGLIALAVSAQIPCEMISYFEEKATLAEGATQQEQLEAVLMSAIIRHWSTMLNGFQIDKNEFRQEVDKVMLHLRKMMESSNMQMPPEEMFLVNPISVDDTYKDIDSTLGFVPKFFQMFPKEGIPGAWSEFKGLQLNPYTALSGKQKEMIGLGIAAQIPCDYCIYFHRSAAILNGANDRELSEAVSIAAEARHWSTVFHGPQIDVKVFKKEADKMIRYSSQRHLQ
jgi:AhpD family alkylhydroperoxidase